MVHNLPLWLIASFTITYLLAFLWPLNLIIDCGYRLIGQLFHRYQCLQNWLISAITDNSTDYRCNTICNLIKIGYLFLFHTNHLHNQSENWCLVGLLNIGAYFSVVKESNSKPVTYFFLFFLKTSDLLFFFFFTKPVTY